MAITMQSDPTKVIGRRVLATLIDAALILVPSIALVSSSLEYLPEDRLDRPAEEWCEDFLDAEGGFCFNMVDVDERVYFADSVPVGSTLLFWGMSLALLVVLQGLTGWTPGKLAAGIRTVGEDGAAPGICKALLRWVLWLLDGFPYVLPLVGFITALTTVGHRRVGDMAAKTFVVSAAAAGSPIVVPGLTAPPPPAGYAAGVPWGTTAPPPGQPWGAPPPSGSPQPGQPGQPWGAPSAQQPVAPPVQQPAAPPAAPTTTPQWDEARGTYIQWDPAQGAWLQWDDTAKVWTRIPGQ